MLGCLGVIPVFQEGRKIYLGAQESKGWAEVRAEASSCRISNSSLRCLRVFLPPECCFLPSPVSYRYKPYTPPCQLFLFCQGRSIWQVGEGLEVLWPQVPSMFPTRDQREPPRCGPGESLSSVHGPLYFSREMSSAKSSC